MKKLSAFILLSVAALGATAERADAGKKAVIDYNNMLTDEVTQTTTLTGNVVVTKGTLLLKAEKAIVKQTPEGDVQLTLIAAGGKLASIRQKRDGGANLWGEGEANRIEYDERTAVVKLISNASFRQLEGERMTREIRNDLITYDSLRQLFTGNTSGTTGGGVAAPSTGRGRMIIEPGKRATPAPAPAPAAAPKGAI